jgi:hypothetical protein
MMVEKMRFSRWMVVRWRGQTTCTEQRRRTGRSGEVSIPDELQGDTRLCHPKVYYGSR